ncbi:sensor protein RstB [compost metagenome]
MGAPQDDSDLHFDVKSGLKRVLGRELITNDEVAIFELVKNSFDAKASRVWLYFDSNRVVIADNGSGMTFEDVKNKWLSVAYSSKREVNGDFRDIAASRSHFAGSKGIGRFSSDRLGERIRLQTRSNTDEAQPVQQVDIDWSLFERDDLERFENIPLRHSEHDEFTIPSALNLEYFGPNLRHGTVLEISGLRQVWDRDSLKKLKSSLAKLINPFGSTTDDFSIIIVAPDERAADTKARAVAKKRGEEVPAREVINGRVGNFIFSALRDKTTFISVSIEGGSILTTLTDRGELVYSIRERNEDYPLLDGSNFHCDIFYLNQSARLTFARRVGLPSVQFGSVFLFRNDFRVFPIGEENDDWFGFNRRKQQGHSRYLGGREVIGRIDISGDESRFQEASSRNQGLIETPAVVQLQRFVMENCLKRLEKYVVPVSWVDKGESSSEDISRLLTDPGKARVAKAVASLVDNSDIELIDFSRQLISTLNERSSEFEGSIASIRAIAEKVNDSSLLEKVSKAERRFEELRQSEIEARRTADRERDAAIAATARAEAAEAAAEEVSAQIETEKRRSHFLESIVDIDAATILNLHHQVTIYSVNSAQQIENFLTDTADMDLVPRSAVLSAFEQLSYLNAKIYAVARFAARARFQLDSEKITTNLPEFITDYIQEIAKQFSSARMRIDVHNSHPGMEATFNPIDVSIIVDNLISNASKAKASMVEFSMTQDGKSGMLLTVRDTGRGISKGVDPSRIFDMGYTTTRGSGLGLYHVRHMLGLIGGTIELAPDDGDRGTKFLIRISPARKQAK